MIKRFATGLCLALVGGAAQAAATIDVEDYFPLGSGDHWHYTGAGQPGSSADDDFAWDVQAALKDINGVLTSQILTTSDEPTDDRNLDRDFWAYDAQGNLRFYGFHNGKADGSGLTAFPVQDVILDQPFLFGTRGMAPDADFTDTISAPVQTGLGSLTASITLTADYQGILPVVKTTVGDFYNVLHLTTSITVVSIGGFPANIDFRSSEFYFASGIGMVMQDQNGDPNDAEIQVLDGANVGGSAVVPDAPPGGTLEAIINYLLDPAQPVPPDLNGDGPIDAGDLVTYQKAPPTQP